MAKNLELARAFVVLEAETKGLDGQLQQAERSLGRTAKFILDNPVAAACCTLRAPMERAVLEVYFGDNLEIIRGFPAGEGGFDLIYIDPPFNTGKVQSRPLLRTQPTRRATRSG